MNDTYESYDEKTFQGLINTRGVIAKTTCTLATALRGFHVGAFRFCRAA